MRRQIQPQERKKVLTIGAVICIGIGASWFLWHSEVISHSTFNALTLVFTLAFMGSIAHIVNRKP